MPLVSKPRSFACRAERLTVVDDNPIGGIALVLFDGEIVNTTDNRIPDRSDKTPPVRVIKSKRSSGFMCPQLIERYLRYAATLYRCFSDGAAACYTHGHALLIEQNADTYGQRPRRGRKLEYFSAVLLNARATVRLKISSEECCSIFLTSTVQPCRNLLVLRPRTEMRFQPSCERL